MLKKIIYPLFLKEFIGLIFTPENIERGGHAHIELQQVLIAVSGSIFSSLVETITGEKYNFNLNKPNLGLFIPKKVGEPCNTLIVQFKFV